MNVEIRAHMGICNVFIYTTSQLVHLISIEEYRIKITTGKPRSSVYNTKPISFLYSLSSINCVITLPVKPKTLSHLRSLYL